MQKRKTQEQKVNNQFNDLVRNALDFLKKSIDEIEVSPKHSIIDFYTAVELLIKARLLKEHWSLIIKKIETADFNKFLNGDFQSVSLDDAKERLKKIVGEDIGNDAYQQFDKVRKHRNQLVHFHNKTSNLKEIVAGDVLKGLHLLNVLLNEKWQPHFKNFKLDLFRISEKAHKLRDYLKVKFDILEPEIDKEKSDGANYQICASCGFHSLRKTELHKNIFTFNCKVCVLQETLIQIECPDCSNKVNITEGSGFCSKCEKEFEIEEILELFEPETPFNKESLAKNEAESRNRAFCDECGWLVGKATVFPIDKDFQKWLCINCDKSFEHVTECPHCASLEAGIQDLSLGCTNCQ